MHRAALRVHAFGALRGKQPTKISDPAVYGAAKRLDDYTRMLEGRLRDYWSAETRVDRTLAIIEAGVAAKLARRPAVMHLRGNPGFGGAYWLAAQFLADRIVPVAHALESDVRPEQRRKIRVVHNGVDLPAAVPDRAEARRAAAGRLGIPELAGGDERLFVSLSSPTPLLRIQKETVYSVPALVASDCAMPS